MGNLKIEEEEEEEEGKKKKQKDLLQQQNLKVYMIVRKKQLYKI